MDAPVADLRTSIPAIRRFLRACTARPLDEELWSAALCWNMAVPAQVRGALLAREIDATDTLSRLSLPVLVTHGRADTIVLPSMDEHAVRNCKTAMASWYDGVGHMPFVEDAERFNLELAAFVDQARASLTGPRSSSGRASRCLCRCRSLHCANWPRPPVNRIWPIQSAPTGCCSSAGCWRC